MKKAPFVFIKHILESIELVETYTSHLTLKAFLSDKKVQDSVLRRLEVIGEAAKNIPKSYKDKYKTVPWKAMAGMRDVLIHEYFGVDLIQVWNTAKKDLPSLKRELLKCIEGKSKT